MSEREPRSLSWSTCVRLMRVAWLFLVAALATVCLPRGEAQDLVKAVVVGIALLNAAVTVVFLQAALVLSHFGRLRFRCPICARPGVFTTRNNLATFECPQCGRCNCWSLRMRR